jgi:hypothetical protein
VKLRADRCSVEDKPREELVEKGRNKREKRKLMTFSMAE